MPENRNDDTQLPPSTLGSWPLLASEVLYAFPIYRLRRDSRRSPRTGNVHTFLVLDVTDWVNVVPVTPEGNVVLIRQFRHGTGSFVLEIPGGMVDPADPNPEEAARRELLEETGYTAERFHYLGSVHPNPAIQSNQCHTFLAESARRAQQQHLEGSEDIEVLEVPYERVADMIARREITHALVVTAFFWYEHYLKCVHPRQEGPQTS